MCVCVYSAFRKYSDPLHFFQFCYVAAWYYNCLIFFFSLIYNPYLIMTKWKQNFRNVCKFIKKKKNLKYHIYISIQTLCKNTWNLAQVPPISLDHCWDVSTPCLESTCGKVNWLDMIWKGTHLSIKGLTADNAYQSENHAMTSKELPAELRDRIVSRHRSGEGYQNNSAELKVPKVLLSEDTWKHTWNLQNGT